MKRPALILFALAFQSLALAFSVSPMVAEFDPNKPRSQQVFVLSNPTDQEKPIEISVGKPIIGADGLETLEVGNGENEFMIIPQQFVLPPNSKRSVKVFYVGEPRQEEDSYRILFKELPVELPEDNSLQQGESSFSMRIVMQYHTRIWLTPAGLEENLSIKDFQKVDMSDAPSATAEATEEGHNKVPMLRLTVANTGQKHGYLRYPEINLVCKDGYTYKIGKETLEPVSGQVVMKDSEKQFNIRWQDDFPPFSDVERITLKTRPSSR